MHPSRYALSRFAVLSIGFGLVAFPARLALAEEITWNSSSKSSDLQDTIWGGEGYDLAPKGNNFDYWGYKSDSLSGNVITVGEVGDDPLAPPGSPPPPIPGSVYGAVNRLNINPLTNNKVVINSGGVVGGDVYGGWASPPSTDTFGGQVSNIPGTITVERNTVTIKSGASVGGKVVGGYVESSSSSNDAAALNNQVTIDDNVMAMGKDMAGGVAISSSTSAAQAYGNILSISNSTVHGAVDGGYAESDKGDATASSNGVFISNSTVDSGSDLSGGHAGSGGKATASDNVMSISGSQVSGPVYGGYATSSGGNATATGNQIGINGGQVNGGVLGGMAYVDSGSGSVQATDNEVGISGGAVINGNIVGGYAHSASGAITVARNTVTISGGQVIGSIYGGFAYSLSGAATATNNSVTISDNPVFAPATALFGGIAGNAAGVGDSFTGNTLNKNSNAAVWNVGNFEFINFGNIGNAGIAYLDTTPTGSAQPGVRINTNGYNITFDGSIVGTGSLTKDGAGTLTLARTNTYTGPTEVRGGTLALFGTGTISPMLSLYDGTTFNTGGLNVTYLNQLDVHGSATWNGYLSMGTDQTMSFHVPASMGNNGTMLTVTNGNADITGSALTLDFDSRKSMLREGDQIKLINVATPGNTLTAATPFAPITTLLGIALDYTFDITTETNNKLLATVTDISANEQTKSLSEGFVSGPALLNQTADFITGEGMTQAVAAAGGGRPGTGKRTRTITTSNYTVSGFGAVTGGQSRYDTGSYADLSSLSLIAGLAWGHSVNSGRVTLGTFFEYGNGSYDTYNSFANAADVHGEGDIYHLGGGVLGRLDFSQGKAGNLYTEVSLRAGRVTNDYKNGNLNGQAVTYGFEQTYYGMHVGLGYVFNLTKTTALDLYGKYFWTRQNGASVLLSSGDPVQFADIASQRLRIGGRFSFAVSDLVLPYIGAAYEQEFDGEAKATVYGYAIDAPSLQGSTAIGEIGLTIKASSALPLSLDLGARGYVGAREGLSGNLQLRYNF